MFKNLENGYNSYVASVVVQMKQLLYSYYVSHFTSIWKIHGIAYL